MPRAPLPVRVTSLLMIGSALLLGIWAVATLVKYGEFSSAAAEIFNADVTADMSWGFVTLAYQAGAVASLVLAGVLSALMIGLLRSHNRARIGFWITCLAALPLLWMFYIKNTTYISAVGTGPTEPVARMEMARVNELTPWRFSGWYHDMTLGVGVAVAIFLVAGAALLVSPASRHHFRAR